MFLPKKMGATTKGFRQGSDRPGVLPGESFGCAEGRGWGWGGGEAAFLWVGFCVPPRKALLTHLSTHPRSPRISDIRLFIVDARPAMAATSFVLMTTFPNKELADENQTLKEANLLNAVIVQRLT